jgi:hypothetical protein
MIPVGCYEFLFAILHKSSIFSNEEYRNQYKIRKSRALFSAAPAVFLGKTLLTYKCRASYSLPVK